MRRKRWPWVLAGAVVFVGVLVGVIFLVVQNRNNVTEQKLEEEKAAWYDDSERRMDDALADGDFALAQEIIEESLRGAVDSGDKQFAFDVQMGQVILFFRTKEYDRAREIVAELKKDVEEGSENDLLLDQYMFLMERLSNET